MQKMQRVLNMFSYILQKLQGHLFRSLVDKEKQNLVVQRVRWIRMLNSLHGRVIEALTENLVSSSCWFIICWITYSRSKLFWYRFLSSYKNVTNVWNWSFLYQELVQRIYSMINIFLQIKSLHTVSEDSSNQII